MDKLIKYIQANKYRYAVMKLMLFSATLHMILLFLKAFQTGDLSVINYINIIELNILFPGITELPYYNVIATAAAVVLFVLFTLV